MTLLFAKSYKNDALHELEVEAVPRLQLRRQFPPLRLHECVHSNNALQASRHIRVSEAGYERPNRERCYFTQL